MNWHFNYAVLCSVVSHSLPPHGLYLTRLLCPWNSLGKNTGVGSLSPLQGIFLTQESNQGFLHCRWILYQLSYQGNPLMTSSNLNFLPKTVSLNTIILRVSNSTHLVPEFGKGGHKFSPLQHLFFFKTQLFQNSNS